MAAAAAEVHHRQSQAEEGQAVVEARLCDGHQALAATAWFARNKTAEMHNEAVLEEQTLERKWLRERRMVIVSC